MLGISINTHRVRQKEGLRAIWAKKPIALLTVDTLALRYDGN
jgi:hypothetical protein